MKNNGNLEKRDYDEFVKIVVRKLREISTDISKPVIVSVAKKISAQYPQTFFSFDGTKKTSEDPVKLIAKLIGRRNYMRSEDFKNNKTAKKNQKRKVDYSIVNVPQNASKEEQQKITKIKNELVKKFQNGDLVDEGIREKMKICYNLQRAEWEDISKQAAFLEDWPFLSTSVCFKDHILNLKGIDILQFKTNFDSKKTSIERFMNSCKRNKIVAINKLSLVEDVRTIKLIMAYLGSDEDQFLKEFVVSKFFTDAEYFLMI